MYGAHQAVQSGRTLDSQTQHCSTGRKHKAKESTCDCEQGAGADTGGADLGPAGCGVTRRRSRLRLGCSCLSVVGSHLI